MSITERKGTIHNYERISGFMRVGGFFWVTPMTLFLMALLAMGLSMLLNLAGALAHGLGYYGIHIEQAGATLHYLGSVQVLATVFVILLPMANGIYALRSEHSSYEFTDRSYVPPAQLPPGMKTKKLNGYAVTARVHQERV